MKTILFFYYYLEKNVQIEVEKTMVHVLKDMEFAVHVRDFYLFLHFLKNQQCFF